jgi:hypothetical protein
MLQSKKVIRKQNTRTQHYLSTLNINKSKSNQLLDCTWLSLFTVVRPFVRHSRIAVSSASVSGLLCHLGWFYPWI